MKFNRTRTFCLLLILLLYKSYFAAQAFSSGHVTGPLEFISSNLPIVVIDTYGKSILDEYRIVAHMKIIHNGEGQRNYATDLPNEYDGKIAIELRGSSSLSYPKKQYRFETQDSLGENLNISILGLPGENDWIFYGPYDDGSLIRNVLAYKLSNDIGRYASRTRFCELVINRDYRGLYVLMEKIKCDRYRVNISHMDSSDTVGDALTGGYIIKIDKMEGENIGYWRSYKGTYYQYHYPRADQITPEQKSYIRNFMNTFETVMIRTECADPNNGYPKYIDVESFVDHFILNEFCKNVDAYRISAFMYKDRDSEGTRLNAGPIWDFNLSLGKAWFSEDNYLIKGWEVDHNHYRPDDWPKVPFWWEKLGHEPAFASRVETRWRDLRDGILQKDSLYSTIDSLVDFIAEARERNFQRWPKSGNAETYMKEIQLLKQWIDDRIDWIDENIDKLTSAQPLSQTETTPKRFALEQNYPNPFNQITKIRFGLPKTSKAKIEIYNISGQKVLTLIDSRKPAGYHIIEFNAANLPSSVYFYRIQADNFKDVKKMTYLK